MAGTDVLTRSETPGRAPSWRGWEAHLRRARWWIRKTLWLLPALGALVGAGLALRLVAPDMHVGWGLRGLAWRATPDEARQVLSAVLGIALTSLSIILSLSMLVVQNTGTQYSPRLMRLFLSAAGFRVVIPVFVTTCVYCMVAVNAFGLVPDARELPRPALSVAILLLVGCVAALIFQVLHTTQLMRVENLVRLVTSNTLHVARALDHRREQDLPAPAAVPRLPERTSPLRAREDGFVVDVNARALLAVATARDLVIHVDASIGEPVLKGALLGRVGLGAAPLPDLPRVLESLTGAIVMDRWRDPEADVALGLRQLVDMAIKALSPAVNDPYTAVEALDQLTAVLCGLCGTRLGPRVLADPGGRPRVLVRAPTLRDYLELATDQIARYGAGEPTVVLRLMRLTGEVARHARTDEERRAARDTLHAVLAVAERGLQGTARLEQVRQHARATGLAMDGGPLPPLPAIGF